MSKDMEYVVEVVLRMWPALLIGLIIGHAVHGTVFSIYLLIGMATISLAVMLAITPLMVLVSMGICKILKPECRLCNGTGELPPSGYDTGAIDCPICRPSAKYS